MAEAMAGLGMALRPHVKTHKSVALAKLQIAAGAVGVTVGTLGEAEVMAGGGIADILIAYPLWASGNKARRLRALLDLTGPARGRRRQFGSRARALAAATSGSTRPLPGLPIEIDPGYGRTGVTPGSGRSPRVRGGGC